MSGELDLPGVQASWTAVLEAVKQQSKRIGAFLQMSEPVGVDGGVLVLQFRAGYGLHAEQCSSQAGQATIGAALERVLGSRPQLRCVVAELGSDPPSPVTPPAAPESDDEAAAVAETEAAEHVDADGVEQDRHDEAIARLESALGATVVDDQRP